MWAIRELPFTLSTGGGYLSCTGWGQRVTYEGYNPGSYGKFYVQIPSSITGIPYLIYSNYSKTRLAVGHYTSNPESKILLAMSSNSTTGAMDSWDIIPATNNPGTYVLQNELYLGQGSSGSWWDVFNYVVDIQANNVGFSQYTQRAQQEFTITPDAVFTLKSLEFINPYSATVTQRENVSIKRAITNSSSQFIRENLVFEKAIQEDSYFKEEKGIAFKVPASDMLFARPTVTLGEIDLVPNASIPIDTKYQPNVRRVMENTLKHIEPVKVSPRTKLTVTYYFKEYDVSVDYVATIEYKEKDKDARIAKLPGRWSGRIHVDEISDVDLEETNLDTQQSVKRRVNTRNASQSSPIILKK